jgi:hypothetical protein
VQPGTDETAAVAVLLRRAAAKDSPGVVFLKAKTLPDIVNLQLQHVGIDAVLPFSGLSSCSDRPPPHIQLGGCLQLAQTWSNF